MDKENISRLEAVDNPESETTSQNSMPRKIGGFALRVAEVAAYTGVAWASQELIFHDSLPVGANMAIAIGAAYTTHAIRNKK